MADLSRQARGAYGERRAAQWYEARGATVLARNWRDGRAGEIDLIVEVAETIVFCEVKARRNADYGSPAEAVTPTKQARMRRLAAAWLQANPQMYRRTIRFDVIAVLGTELEVYEDVLGA